MDKRQNKIDNDEQIITDCSHLIDLAPASAIFSNKFKGNSVKNSKAKIKTLTIFRHKNGLSNLL